MENIVINNTEWYTYYTAHEHWAERIGDYFAFRRFIDREDCKQEARIGLFLAAQSFKKSLSVPFKNWARREIMHRLWRWFFHELTTYPVTRYEKDARQDCRSMEVEIEKAYGIRSIEADRQMRALIARIEAEQHIRRLDLRSAVIMILFAHGYSEPEIARVYGVSRSRIGKIAKTVHAIANKKRAKLQPKERKHGVLLAHVGTKQ